MRRKAAQSIRVLVAEPFPATSEVICRALEAPGVEVVGRVRDRRAILARTRALRPDVVVLDGALGYRNRVDLIAQLKAVRRAPKVIVLGNTAEAVYREAAVASGADRFVLKVRLIKELLPAVRSTLAH